MSVNQRSASLLRRCVCVAAEVVFVFLLATSGAEAAGSAGSMARPSFCDGSGPIPASLVASPVDLASCPLIGRTIEMDLPTGSSLGVAVPSSGTNLGVLAMRSLPPATMS